MNNARILAPIALMFAVACGALSAEHIAPSALADTGTGGSVACSCPTPAAHPGSSFEATTTTGGVKTPINAMSFDGETVSTGWAFTTIAGFVQTSSNYLILTVYDCGPGDTVFPLSGCVNVAQYNGASSTVAASTATAFTSSASYPYTLASGHSFQIVYAKVIAGAGLITPPMRVSAF